MPGRAPALISVAALALCGATQTASAATHRNPSLPLVFEENRGQWPAPTRFGVRSQTGLALEARRGGPVLRAGGSTLRLRVVGGRRTVDPVAERLGRGVVNDYPGPDRRTWVTHAPTSAAVRYAGIRPGVDLVLHGDDQVLEYDLDLARGVDPESVAVAIDGARNLRVDRRTGDLIVGTRDGELRQRRPVTLQDGRRIRTRFRLGADGLVRFDVLGRIDRRRPLTIDPKLQYASYVGGSSGDTIEELEVDANGNVTMILERATAGLAGASNSSSDGLPRPAIVKLNAAGQLVYATYVGNTSVASFNGLVLDPTGGAAVAGDARCQMPVTSGAFDENCSGDTSDGYVARFSASGTLLAATYMGPNTPTSGADHAWDLARASDGDYIVFGNTTGGFPVNGPDQTFGGGFFDAFLLRLPSTLSGPAVYSRYFGGNGDDADDLTDGGDSLENRIALQGDTVVISSNTTSPAGVAAGEGADTTRAGASDGLLAAFDAATGTTRWATYLGTDDADGERLGDIVPYGSGQVMVTGRAHGPLLSGAATRGTYQQSTIAGQPVSFVARLDVSSPAVQRGTYLGETFATTVDVGPANEVLLGGSGQIPTTPGAFDTTYDGAGWFAALAPDLGEMRYATALDVQFVVDAESHGQVAHIAATVNSPDHIGPTAGAYDTDRGGGVEGLVIEMDWKAPETTITPERPSPTNDSTPSFFLTADEPSTFACRLDSASLPIFLSCDPDHTLPRLEDGSYTLEARATDTAGGNTDPTAASVTFVVDTRAPRTTISGGPTGPTADKRPAFTFDADERGASYQCRFDAAPAHTDCTSGFKPGFDLGEGAHTFRVRARDAAGNVESPEATRSFVVDSIAPDTTITAGPTPVSSDTRPAFQFHSTEAAARFECRMDRALLWSTCTPGFRPTFALEDGEHGFEVRSVDTAGNVDPEPAFLRFVVDTIAPDTELRGPTGPTADSTPSVQVVSEGGTGFRCALDDVVLPSCPAVQDLGPLPDGPHVFTAAAVDAAGNIDASPARLDFVVDTVAPQTEIELVPARRRAGTAPTFRLTSDEAGATFECAVDDAALTGCDATHTPPGDLAPGTHSLRARAIDAAGNVDATPAQRDFEVAAEPPPTPTPAVSPSPSPSPSSSPLPSPTATPVADAFAVLDAPALALACDKRRVALIDVVPASAGKVTVTGAATAALFAGRPVDVLRDGRRVASATVGPDGAISVRAPAPPAARAQTARYQLRSGSDVSRNVKVSRRLIVTSLAVQGGRVVIKGKVAGPAPRRFAPILFRRQTSCSDFTDVGSVTPTRSGAFTARLPLPTDARAAVYRGQTKVAARRGAAATLPSFTLPRAVNLR